MPREVLTIKRAADLVINPSRGPEFKGCNAKSRPQAELGH